MSAAPAAIITPENCPRDEAGLMRLSRVVRYRLALGIGLFGNETPEESAFAGADDQTQIQTLLTALQARDAQMNNGQPPHPGQQYAPPPQYQQPQAPAVLTPQPLAVAPAPGTYVPQQHMPPPSAPPQYQLPPAPTQYTPQPMHGAPPGAVPAQAAPPPPQQYQQPPQQYQQPPAPPVYAPPPPMPGQGAMPPQPQYQQPPQQPPAPQPAYAPPPPQGMPPAPGPMMRQPSTIGDPTNNGARQPVPGSDLAKLVELENAILGMARTQNMMFNLVLELGQHMLGLDKQTIATRLIQHAQSGEPMRFFEAGAPPGKVG